MTQEHGTALLEVSGLTTRVRTPEGDQTAVSGVGFTLHAGETLVLVGESGSGKSMTALSLMRLLPPAARLTAGQVQLGQQDLTRLSETAMRAVRGRRMAMIFQEPMTSLNPVMRIGDQVVEAIRRHRRIGRRAAWDRARQLLEETGIADARQRMRDYPHQFSGGMKQRAMIAMALSREPQLLIADEPTTALDVTTQAQILTLLKRLQAEHGMGILLVTHDLGVAAAIADRIAVMRAGEIVETASREQFFTAPRHDYSQALFRALPSASKRGRTLTGDHRLPVSAALPPASEPLLQIESLAVTFGHKSRFGRTDRRVHAVRDVNLALARGETLALVGESGSGKTTLAKAVLQLIPSSGSIRFGGTDLSTLSRHELRRWRRRCQFVFQDPFSSLNPRMTVDAIIQEGMIAQNIGGGGAQRRDRVAELLEQVGLLAEHVNRYPHEFSGGQRQRIAIARALAVEPELLICDEPTSALDLSIQAQILDLLSRLREERGLAFLFITHNLSVVDYFADQVAIMKAGRIVERGPVEQIMRDPRDPYSRQLLEAVLPVPLPALANSDVTQQAEQ
ncbi:MAG: ABC transporter ATP-binding protein [Pseudomonadota bacterium]|nr:ABC transporter ATP-binding protein [Pseudomonadota bacterium]